MVEHCSGDENVSKKRKFIADTPNPPCESIPQIASETVHQNPDELVGDESDMMVSNIFPSANERVLLELDGLMFESPYMGSQSQRLCDGFFCTQVPKVDIDKSSFVDGAPTNADLKKEINDFRLHVDVKFGEILEVLSHLTKKLEEKKMNERCYSEGGDTVFPNLGMDADEDAL
ncbi:hypothetical protein HAX54_012490 [Datura stramonium]|uniref:Uncharacterized protein n=1 Tax=Datura stramonium TaxID=4076 RepID=A0ABS8Y160_DATST|nr:hypothetical protein [Datura stramonium]